MISFRLPQEYLEPLDLARKHQFEIAVRIHEYCVDDACITFELEFKAIAFDGVTGVHLWTGDPEMPYPSVNMDPTPGVDDSGYEWPTFHDACQYWWRCIQNPILTNPTRREQ